MSRSPPIRDLYCVYPDEYKLRKPKNTPLFRLLDFHYEEFRNVYEERFSKRYGYWRPITDEVVEKYLRCGDPHYGFARIRCEECGAPINADDINGRKTLSEYISRASFSLERMSFNENSKTVVYRGERFHTTLARNFEVKDPLEWIARITSYIPRKGAKQIIYYGACSQAWRGRKHRQGFYRKHQPKRNLLR